MCSAGRVLTSCSRGRQGVYKEASRSLKACRSHQEALGHVTGLRPPNPCSPGFAAAGSCLLAGWPWSSPIKSGSCRRAHVVIIALALQTLPSSHIQFDRPSRVRPTLLCCSRNNILLHGKYPLRFALDSIGYTTTTILPPQSWHPSLPSTPTCATCACLATPHRQPTKQEPG